MSNAFDTFDRSEIINGVVYNMAPPSGDHIRVSGNIYRIIGNQLMNSMCEVAPDGFPLYQDKEAAKKGTNYVLPDVMMYCDVTNEYDDKYYGTPGLIVEVLSRSTRDRDLTVKMDLYASKGVPEYWTVEWKIGLVTVHYLSENGMYKVHKSYELVEDKEDEDYNADEEIMLKACNNIKVRLGDIFHKVRSISRKN